MHYLVNVEISRL